MKSKIFQGTFKVPIILNFLQCRQFHFGALVLPWQFALRMTLESYQGLCNWRGD